jgi:hypothetical protein
MYIYIHTHTYIPAYMHQDGLEFYDTQWKTEIEMSAEERKEHWMKLHQAQGKRDLV